MEQPILPLRDAPVLADAAAVWFSRRWGIPAESYRCLLYTSDAADE